MHSWVSGRVHTVPQTPKKPPAARAQVTPLLSRQENTTTTAGCVAVIAGVDDDGGASDATSVKANAMQAVAFIFWTQAFCCHSFRFGKIQRESMSSMP